jgi:mRNA interferase YafQ
MKLFEVTFSKSFSKSLKRHLKSGSFDVEKLKSTIESLTCGKVLPHSAKDHPLKANWVGYRECHLEPDLLLIYKIEGDKLALSYLGSHSELFG